MLMFGLNRRSKKPTVRKPRPVYDPTARYRTVHYIFPKVQHTAQVHENASFPLFDGLSFERITINQP